MTTISTNRTTQVSYGNASSSPVTLNSGISITVATDYPGALALLGNPAATNNWSFANFGTVSDGQPGHSTGVGVQIGGFFNAYVSSGTVSNKTNASIYGDASGVYIIGTIGSVYNSGMISGANFSGVGIDLKNLSGASGYVNNVGTIQGKLRGVFIEYGFGTVDNSGLIAGSTTHDSSGVLLAAGGSVITTGGIIEGYRDGVRIVGTATANVLNGGTIENTGPADLGNSAGLYVSPTTAINGIVASVDNFVLITAPTAGSGIDINLGNASQGSASITNEGGGTISGVAAAISVAGGGATITNQTGGLISGTNGGISVSGGAAAITNDAAITATAAGSGIHLTGGGNVTNNSGGVIYGYQYGINANTAAVTVVNSNTIRGAAKGSDGIYFGAGGTVTNNSGGLIQGNEGLQIRNAAGTVINMGNIVGLGGLGVQLYTGGSLSNISGSISGQFYGVIFGATGNVTNSAKIYGNAGNSGADFGLRLEAGGHITNNSGGLIRGASGAEIQGTAAGGIAGTLTNIGIITGTLGSLAEGVAVEDGGSVNNSGGTIEGYSGIVSQGTAAVTITNSGQVLGTIAPGSGIFLRSGGSIDNTAGLIEGANGIDSQGATTIVNASGATIAATASGSDSILMTAGGTVTNHGLIRSGGGIVIGGGAGGSVINTGMIVSTQGNAVYLTDAYVLNGAGGQITGAKDGVKLTNGGGTVIDAGSIAGGGGSYDAVYLGAGSNLLELEPNYHFSGGPVVAAGAGNTLELVGTTGVPFAVNYTNFTLTGFQDVRFAGNATLDIGLITGSPTFTISNFVTTSDTIDLTGIGTNGHITGTANNVVTVVGQNGTVMLDFDGTDTLNPTTQTDSHNGIFIVPCFCRGTRIQGEGGERPVEALKIGDRVATLSGELRPIKWIGRRSYGGRFIAGNHEVLPITVKAGALADGVPVRDLHLSPHHALYLDGVLVPAECLVNGCSIVQSEAVDRVDYFHIELDSHDVILADGTPVETFVDCDSRAMFHNAGEFARLYPGEEPPPWAFCAPRVEDDVRVEVLWRRLAARAGLDPVPGLLQGHLDGADRQSVCGWARDAANPDLPVLVEIVADGVVVGRALANRYRPDLATAGFGHGRHGFEFALPPTLTAGCCRIAARRAGDGAELAQSPRLLTAA